MTEIATDRACRACGEDLRSVLNLGTLALNYFPLPVERDDRQAARAPLDLGQCERCGLVQLRHTVPPDRMFRQDRYRSGVNEVMRAELTDVVFQACQIAPPAEGAIVLDVGANDGTLLDAYPTGVRKVAVDPAQNLRGELMRHADDVWPTYFPDRAITRRYAGRVRILTSIACFYDLDDPGAFVEAVAQLLAPGGIWVVQFQDLHQMVQATAFDNVCFEHLVYYSLQAIERLIAPYGLTVIAAQRRPINGGSYRLVIARASERDADRSVPVVREAEAQCEHWETLAKFAWRVEQRRTHLTAILRAALRRGETIDLYGASTKANTLLQVCGIDQSVCRQAWERAPEKWGRETITGIPIVPEGEGRADRPDLLLVGIWQFREAVIQREAAYLGAGGAILFPLPSVDVVTGAGQGVTYG